MPLLLEITFDCSLRMLAGITKLSKEAGWRLQSILRPRRFFSERQLMTLYKSRVLSFIEAGTPGYYHAAPSVLYLLDRVQHRLLRELQLSEDDALFYHNLAPLRARRDIAMLGLLHRRVLGQVSLQLTALFPFQQTPLDRYSTRLASSRHPFQLEEPRFHTNVFRRSIFGLTVIYNLLPYHVIQAASVKRFQHLLQAALKSAFNIGMISWQSLFSPADRPCDAFTFQRCFE